MWNVDLMWDLDLDLCTIWVGCYVASLTVSSFFWKLGIENSFDLGFGAWHLIFIWDSTVLAPRKGREARDGRYVRQYEHVERELGRAGQVAS